MAQSAWETPACEGAAWRQKSWEAAVQEQGPLEALAALAAPLAGEPLEPGSAERAALVAGIAAAAVEDCIAAGSEGQQEMETGSSRGDFQDDRSSYQRWPSGGKRAAAHLVGTSQVAPAAARRQPVAPVAARQQASRSQRLACKASGRHEGANSRQVGVLHGTGEGFGLDCGQYRG